MSGVRGPLEGSIRRRPDRGPDVWEVAVDLGRRYTPGRGWHRPRRTRQVSGSRAHAEAALRELATVAASPRRRLAEFPLEDLLAAVRVPLSELAVTAGFDPSAQRRWLASGRLTEDAADRLALAAGLHPAIVWPDWCSR